MNLQKGSGLPVFLTVAAGPWTWVLLAVLLNLGLVFNPGYFSHDELQWGHFARTPSWLGMPWSGLGDFDQFQYRPLTFNAWLILARLWFDSPQWMHAVFVLLGLGNAGLVYWVSRGAGASHGHARIAAAMFLASPFAVYVHGWVATLADLLWVACGLLLAGIVLRSRGWTPVALVVTGAGSCALALLAKESALSIALVSIVAWGISRERRWAWAALGVTLACGVYLVLRFEVLLGGATAATGYPVDPLAPPRRLAEYFAFVFDPARFEVTSMAQMSSSRILWATVLVSLAIGIAMGVRIALALFLAAIATLAPVLLLQTGANQYGYGFAVVLALAGSAAWVRVRGLRKGGLVFLAVVSGWHGLEVATEMHRVGRLQSVYSTELARALAQVSGERSIVLAVSCPSDYWIYSRLSHEVPSWRGMPIGSRVRIADSPMVSDGEVRCDGRVVLDTAPTS